MISCRRKLWKAKRIFHISKENETKVDLDYIKNEMAQFLQLDNLNF